MERLPKGGTCRGRHRRRVPLGGLIAIVLLASTIVAASSSGHDSGASASQEQAVLALVTAPAGGLTATFEPGNTQSFDGGDCQALTPGVSFGEQAPYTYRGVGGVLSYVFLSLAGGSTGGFWGTWFFAGGVWTNLTALTGPGPGTGSASLAYDPQTNQILSYGWVQGTGNASSLFFPDTWLFENDTWVDINATLPVSPGPTPHIYGPDPLAYDAEDGIYLLYDPGLNQTWSFGPGGWSNLNPVGEPDGGPSNVHLTYDGETDVAMLSESVIAGNDTQPFSESLAWMFSNGNWSEMNDTLINATTGGMGVEALAYFPPAQEAVGFSYGAENGSSVILSFTYRNGSWADEPSVPVGSSGPTAYGYSVSSELAYDSSDRALVMTGQSLWRNGTWFSPIQAEACASVVPGPIDTNQSLLFNETNLNGSGTWGPMTVDWTSSQGGTSNGSRTFSIPVPRAGSLTIEVIVSVVRTGTSFRMNWTYSVSQALAERVAVLTPTVAAGALAEINVTVTGGKPIVIVSVNWGDGTLASGAPDLYAHVYTKAGSFGIAISAKDGLGEERNTTAAIIVVDQPRVALAWAPTMFVYPGDLVRFWANVSGGAPPYEFTFSFGDGSSSVSGQSESSTLSVTHSFALGGSYTTSVIVVSSGTGVDSASSTLRINVIPAVSLDVTIPVSEATSGQPLLLQAEVSGGIGPYQVNWSFGDAAIATDSLEVYHTYEHPGVFSLRAIASDSHGRTSMWNGTITVAAVSAPPSQTGWIWAGAGAAVVVGLVCAVLVNRRR